MDSRNESHLSILFTNNEEIKELNASFRNKDYATDVLSFSQTEGEDLAIEEEFKSIGDIVISIDKAKEQAKELDVALRYEVFRLLIHGILHLFGYDHENVTELEAEKMRALEDSLFEKYMIDADSF